MSGVCSKRQWFAIVAAFGALATVCLGLGLYHLSRISKTTQTLSAMAWIHAALREQLPAYYAAHGRLPTTLHNLELENYGDGACENMLGKFNYESTKDVFTVSWTTPDGRKVLLTGRGTNILLDTW